MSTKYLKQRKAVKGSTNHVTMSIKIKLFK